MLGLPLFAQYRASLQGTVTDPTGAAIPGATVTLTNKDTNATQTAQTSGSGVYSLTGLAPGNYRMTVEATGFKKQVLDNVLVTSEQAQGHNIELQVGTPTTQTVTVTAAIAPAINTETATVSKTFSGQQIEALPTFGRDPFQAAMLASGSFGDNARSANGQGAANLPGNAGPGGASQTNSIFQTENQVQIVANGTRNASNSFQIDGVEVNSLAWGGAAVITPNQESIKEITVQSNPYNAEYGRNSGAQVLVVSQNGTNHFHGSALMKIDRPGLNAYQRWNGPNNPVQRDENRFNQFAGSLGGPIVRNHLFFFFSYETLRNSTATTDLNWYETPQFDKSAGAPNSIAASILGYPGEGAAFTSIVPKTCADAGISSPSLCQPVYSGGNYLGLDVGSPLSSPLGTPDPGYVSPGNFGAGGGLDGIPDIMNVETRNPTTSNPQQFNGRMDFQATSRDRITFSTYYVPVSTTNYNGSVRPANLWHNNRLNEDGTLLWSHTISPSVLNQARFNVTRWHWNEVTSNPQEPFGLPRNTIDQFGNVTIQPVGPPGPSIFNQTTYNFRDTMSTVVGKHSITFGADLNWEQDNDNLSSAARPTYKFRNIWNLANDAPYEESGNFDPLTGQPTSATKYIRTAIYAFFLQDNYKVSPSLTLNLGLRWEYFTPVREKYGHISNPILGPAADPLTGLTLKVGGQLYHPDYQDWGPQVGFAWNPYPSNERIVVRGGFGLSYNRMEEAITLNGRTNPPLVSGLTLHGSDIYYAVPADAHQFSGWPVNPAAIEAIDPTTNLPTSGAPIDLNGFPLNLKTPRTYSYSLMTEYNLGRQWIATLGYQGSLSRHLTIQNDLNFLYTPLNPMVNRLHWYYNGANANYNALLTEIEHRFSNTFQIDAQYRWSKTIDEGSNSYYVGPYPFGLEYNRGPADFDVRNNVKLYGVWSPRFFTGNGWKHKILGGWEITGIMNWHSGFPWTPLYTNTGGNVVYPNSGYTDLRPGAYLGGMLTDYRNAAFQRANGNFPNGALSYFTVPVWSSTGIPPAPAVGRNILRGPGYFDTDMTLQKSFGLPTMPILGENAKLDLRANFYNIFNTLNLNPGSINKVISTDGTTSNPLFGQAQGALVGRIIEFQARFSF